MSLLLVGWLCVCTLLCQFMYYKKYFLGQNEAQTDVCVCLSAACIKKKDPTLFTLST